MRLTRLNDDVLLWYILNDKYRRNLFEHCSDSVSSPILWRVAARIKFTIMSSMQNFNLLP